MTAIEAGASRRRDVADSAADVRRSFPVAARVVLWCAVLCSFIYSTARTSSGIEAGGIGPFDVVRGGGPVALLVVGVLLAKPRHRRVTAVEVGVAIFLLVAAASTVWSVSPQVTALKAVPLVAVYLALLRLVRLYTDARTAVNELVVVVHLLLVLAAVEAVVVPGLVLVPDGPYSTQVRLNMVVPQISANPLAMLAAVGILAVVLRVGPEWLRRQTALQVGLVIVYLGILLATRTRTALVIGLLLVVGALAAQLNRRAALVSHAALGGIVALFWAWTPERLVLAETFVARGQDAAGLSSLTGRTYLWDLALDKWSEDRLLGFGYYAGHRLGISGIAETQSNIDSTWLELLVDVGVVGTLPLAVAVISGFVRLLRLDAPAPERWWISGVAGAGLAVSFVNPTLQAPGIGLVLFGTALAIAASFSAPSRGSLSAPT